MKTIYLVKKNPAMPKAEDNWIVMNGREFWQFISTEEGKLRSLDFGRMDPCGQDDYAIIAECGKEDAACWNRERAHSNYVREVQKRIEFLSYDLLMDCAADGYYYCRITDPHCDIEGELLRKASWESMRMALLLLPEDMQKLLHDLVACDNPPSIVQYSKTVGLSDVTVGRRLKKAKAQLKAIYSSMYSE